MSRDKEKKSDEGGPDPNAWMATFSDLNFLMITFFVLLLSMSSMDERAFSDVFGDQISPSEDNYRPEPPMGRSPLPNIVPSKGSWVGYSQDIPVDDEPGEHGRHKVEGTGNFQQSQKALTPDPKGIEREERLNRILEKMQKYLKIDRLNNEEIRITVEDSIFFEGDEYQPSAKANEILRAIAGLTDEIDGQLQVQAHRGNWQLAAKRSAAVARAFRRHGVPGDRLAADVITGEEGFLNFAIKRTIYEREGDVETGEDDG